MHLTFSPALGHTTVVKVPPRSSSNSKAGATILFKATFPSQEAYRRARADGVKVELWTDLPGIGSAEGEWGAVQFVYPEDRDAEPMRGDDSGSSGRTFSLRADAGADTDAKDERKGSSNGDAAAAAVLELRTSLGDCVGTRFAFTYRLVYPSGEVRWLGAYGGNGVVAVERGLPGIRLERGWELREDGQYEAGSVLEERVLARLEKPEEWTCWIWKAAKLPVRVTPAEGGEGNAMVFLPKRASHGGAIPKPVVLVARNSGTIRIAADGALHTRVQASLAILEPFSSLLRDVAALCNGAVLPGAMGADAPAVAVASRLPDAALPFHVVVLPTDGAGAHSDAETHALPFGTLQPLALESDGLALYAPALRKVTVARAPLAQERGALLVGAEGGEVVVSPVQSVKSEGGTYQLASLGACRYVRAAVESGSPLALPTPPPSPPASVRPEPAGESEPPVAAAPADVAAQPVVPSSLEPSPDSPRPSSCPPTQQERRRTRRRQPSLSLALVRTLPARVLRAYIHSVLSVVYWFWSVFFRALAVRVVGERAPRRVSGLLRYLLGLTASARSRSRPRSRSGSPGVAGDGGRRETGLETTAPPGKVEAEVKEAEEMEVHETNVDVPSAPPSPRIASPQPHVAVPGESPFREAPPPAPATTASPRVVVTAALLPSQSLRAMLMWKGGPVKGSRATLDGRPLAAPTVVSLAEKTHILSLDEAEVEGLLEVSFDI